MMGRYQEQVARRNARYEYEIPDGALHCEIVTGTEPSRDDEGREVGVRSWRGVRYLLRLDEPVSESQTVVALRELLGESLMRARLALTALDLAETEAIASRDLLDLDETRVILSALCAMLVEAGAVDPMEVD
jgi:hypothetical protein